MPDDARIVVVGVGGQGVLFASKVLAGAAMLEGRSVVMSEVHGMAQRGGVVVCNVSIGDYHGSLVGDCEADIILAFEPVEAYRLLPKANPDTRMITSTSPVIPVAVSIGKMRYPDMGKMFDGIRAVTPKLTALDAEVLAEKAGSYLTINSVLLGALAATPECPVSRESMLKSLEENVPSGTREMNLTAFRLGLEGAREG